MVIKRAAILGIVALLLMAAPALAQTATPTNTPPPLFPVPQFDPIPSPTPIPTADAPAMAPTLDLPTLPLYNFLATADYNLSSAPSDITHNGALPVLPNENGYTLFAYIKWILSPSSADEILWEFSPLIVHFAVYVGLVIFIAGAYVFIFLARIFLRFVIWVISKVRMLIG